MDREQFESAKKSMGCIEGGIKEACLIARERLHNYKNDRSAVTEEEFLAAVETLMAYAWTNRETDVKPPSYECDNDCYMASCVFCPGEFMLGKRRKSGIRTLCPHYSPEDL